MMILGIDPGPTQSAILMWTGDRILSANILPNTDIRLDYTGDVAVAVEHIQCMGMAVGKTVFDTAYWIGEFRLATRLNRLPFFAVTRGEVKMHHCGSMRAKDSNLRQALIDRFGPPGKKASPGLTYGLKGDLWSAFAIAVMVFDKQ